MRALDTNLLVRILTRDDADQVAIIEQLLDDADLTNAALNIEHHSAVELALDAIATSTRRVDFADALHVASALDSQHGPLLTFDRGCARLDGVQLLQ